MPQAIKLRMPTMMRGGDYYKKGVPQCPIAHVMDACKIVTSKRFRNGDNYLSHEYEDRLADFVRQYGYEYWDVIEAINRAVFDTDEVVDKPEELRNIFTTFITKFPKAFQLQTAVEVKSNTPKVPFKAVITKGGTGKKKKNKNNKRKSK